MTASELETQIGDGATIDTSGDDRSNQPISTSNENETNDSSRQDEVAPAHRQWYSLDTLRSLRHERIATLPESIAKLRHAKERKIASLKPNPPTPFFALALPKEISDSLQSLSLTTATPIQATAIPYARLGGDIVAQATSGTGKTLTYALVALDTILPVSPTKCALVIVPARELASQVSEVFTQLAAIRVVTLVGGTKESVDEERLSKAAHVIVGTPGRVEVMVSRGCVDVESIKILVLDEADRLLDGSFEGSVERICKMLPTRQTLAFSATFSYSFRQSLLDVMREPAWIGGNEVVHSVTQRKLFRRDLENKINFLKDILRRISFNLCVIFFNAKKAAGRVVRNLTKAFPFQTKLIHAGMSQKERDGVIKDVRAGNVRVLVTTDVLARGIDFCSCDFVVQMDVPQLADTYFHRVGRAGRFRRSGSSLLMFDESEISLMLALEDDLGYKIETDVALNGDKQFESSQASTETKALDKSDPLSERGLILNRIDKTESGVPGIHHQENASRMNRGPELGESQSFDRERMDTWGRAGQEGRTVQSSSSPVKSRAGLTHVTGKDIQLPFAKSVSPSGYQQAILKHLGELNGTSSDEIKGYLSPEPVINEANHSMVPEKRLRRQDDPATPAKKRKSTRILFDELPSIEMDRKNAESVKNSAQSRRKSGRKVLTIAKKLHQGTVKEKNDVDGMNIDAEFVTSKAEPEESPPRDVQYEENQQDNDYMDVKATGKAQPRPPRIFMSQQHREAWDKYGREAYGAGYREAYDEAYRMASELRQRLMRNAR